MGFSLYAFWARRIDFEVIGVGGGFWGSSWVFGGVCGRRVIISSTGGGENGQIPVFAKPPWIFDILNDLH